MPEKNEVTSPVGRIVWGHPTNRQQATDDHGNIKFKKDGVTPLTYIAFGLAIEKALFQQHIWPVMHLAILAGFPNGAPPNFAYKYVDCDSFDPKGIPYGNREGYAGCIVLACTSYLDDTPSIFKANSSGQYVQVPGSEIKCGDYVAVDLGFEPNVATSATRKSGVYVNPGNILLVQPGEAIFTGKSAEQSFANVNTQLPAGAKVISHPGLNQQGQQPMNNGGMPQQGQQPMNNGGMPQQGQQPMNNGGMPQQGQQPMNNGGMPQQGQQPMNNGGMPAPAHDYTGMQNQQQPMNQNNGGMPLP